MAKNKNRNTVWLVILAVVLLFIWLNASPKSSQVGAQELQLEFDRGVKKWSGIGGGGRVGLFKPDSFGDRAFCDREQKPARKCSACGKPHPCHLHFFAHIC